MIWPSSLQLMRGPFILSGVAASLLWPFISTLSTHSLAHLMLAVIGVAILVWDIWRFTKSSIRERLACFLDNFVLDDFLQRMYDPETGVIPCIVGTFVGASSMYGLRLDDEQKTRLMQASLWTGKEEARSILLDPGGTKAFLPQSILQWLGEGRTRAPRKAIDTIVKPEPVSVETAEEEAESNSCDSDYHNQDHTVSPRPASPEGIHQNARAPQMGVDRPDEVSFQRQELMPPLEIPTDPALEMLKIVRDMMINKLRPWFASIPETKLEILGTAAAVALCAHMVLRARSKPSLGGAIIAMGFSGTVAGAFCAVLLRQAMLGSIRDFASFKLISSAVCSRSLERMKRIITKDKRLSASVALFVLAWVGRKNHRNVAAAPPNLFRR